jgi:DnaA family protein
LPLREDLRTRLGSGLVYHLIPLSDEEKRAALTAQAEARALSLPPGAIDYLLTHATRDMRHLTAILAALDRHSLEYKRPITLPMLRIQVSGIQPSILKTPGEAKESLPCPLSPVP